MRVTMPDHLNGRRMSVVARAIVDPSYRPDDRELATLLQQDDLKPDLLRRIHLFTASALRIKHSFLWNTAPLTTALLRRRDVLLDAFVRYVPHRPLRGIDAIGVRDRTVNFLEFLCSPVECLGDGYSGVRGVSRHELSIIRSRPSEGDGPRPPLPPMSWPAHESAVLTLRSGDLLVGYSSAPTALEGCEEVAPRHAPHMVLYSDGAGSVIDDPLLGRLLDCAARRETIAAARRSASKLGSHPDVDMRLRDLAADGCISMEGA